jgi:hypothetical protein
LQSQKYLFLAFASIDIIFMLLLLLISDSLFHKAFAASPSFVQVLISDKEISNQRNDWVRKVYYKSYSCCR